MGIMYHKGGSASHGHYTAEYRDSTTGNWWHFDDTEVKEGGRGGGRERGRGGGRGGGGGEKDEVKGKTSAEKGGGEERGKEGGRR